MGGRGRRAELGAVEGTETADGVRVEGGGEGGGERVGGGAELDELAEAAKRARQVGEGVRRDVEVSKR